MKTAYLILENGEVFTGYAFGAEKETTGEIVFTTAMTGYLETLTDPSYEGQIVLQTFPLIGNYGVICEDFESAKPHLKAYIVKNPCDTPSNFRCGGSLDEFLKKHDIAGLYGIDTRKLTKIIRSSGVMCGKITYEYPAEKDIEEARKYLIKSPVLRVSPKDSAEKGNGLRRIALLDFGAKNGIEAALVARNCTVKRFPFATPASEILQYSPQGVVLSNGPGDPADPANECIIDTIKELRKIGVPMFGICLGHQLMALASGYETRKLKFGHRGANQPVKELSTGRVFITSQNHGYEVITEDSSLINVNDGSCEGLDYGVSFSVQFHPEACGGPKDTSFLFDRFIERVDLYAKE